MTQRTSSNGGDDANDDLTVQVIGGALDVLRKDGQRSRNSAML